VHARPGPRRPGRLPLSPLRRGGVDALRARGHAPRFTPSTHFVRIRRASAERYLRPRATGTEVSYLPTFHRALPEATGTESADGDAMGSITTP